MMPIVRRQVEILLDTPAERDFVVSAYADMTVQDGFQRYLEVHLKNEGRSAGSALAEAAARKDLDANMAVVREAAQAASSTKARGLAVFSNVARGLRQVIPLEFPVENRLVVDEEPFLMPLLERWYCEPSFLIALCDANEAHLFERHHGRPERGGDLERADAAQHIERDKPRFTFKKRSAATQHERLRGTEDAPFLRTVAHMIGERWKSGDFAGLMLLGQPQMTAALRKLLPRGLDSLVAAEAPHAMTDSAAELDEVLSRLVDDWQNEQQRRVLDEWNGRRQENHLVACGPTEVLDALQQGRATQVLLGTRRDIPGARCPGCGYRHGAPIGLCVYCGAACQNINAAQEVLRLALRHKVAVLLSRMPPGDDPLEAAGGAAALLRAEDNWAPRPQSSRESEEQAEAV